MLGTRSILNEEALAALRRLVQTTHEQRSVVPALELVQLANNVKIASGITIDFTAAHQLDAPMVVVCVPIPASDHHELPELPGLTRRENQVAALVSEGLSNKQIARHLRITLGYASRVSQNSTSQSCGARGRLSRQPDSCCPFHSALNEANETENYHAIGDRALHLWMGLQSGITIILFIETRISTQ